MTIMHLIKLMLYDDCYYKTVMAENMLNTPEMENLRKHAHKHGFRIDMERLDTIEGIEKFLGMYDENTKGA